MNIIKVKGLVNIQCYCKTYFTSLNCVVLMPSTWPFVMLPYKLVSTFTCICGICSGSNGRIWYVVSPVSFIKQNNVNERSVIKTLEAVNRI